VTKGKEKRSLVLRFALPRSLGFCVVSFFVLFSSVQTSLSSVSHGEESSVRGTNEFEKDPGKKKLIVAFWGWNGRKREMYEGIQSSHLSLLSLAIIGSAPFPLFF
jgi:hypothetical protein